MINFTVGPVQSPEEVRALGAENVPYFRTPEFSEVMLENERLVLDFAKAPEGSRAVFLTGSGTAAMEAAVINLLDANDKVLIVNGGSFGQRFVELANLHDIQNVQISLDAGNALDEKDLSPHNGCGFTAMLVNLHETSTGVLYDLSLISDFCKRNDIFLVVDAISCFLADDINMANAGINAMITGSQKALACPPGISIVMLDEVALRRALRIESGCMYLDFKAALKNGERGQTPFTPAVGTLLQINARLRSILGNGGVESEIEKTKQLADHFRSRIAELPFTIFSDSMSNACTALHPTTANAADIFRILKDEYGIWVCPNGGELASAVFRVGHIGDLSVEDNELLINALNDMHARGLI